MVATAASARIDYCYSLTLIFLIISVFLLVAYFRNGEDKENEEVKELYERLTFFKPVVGSRSGIIRYDEDVKRILQKKSPAIPIAKL